MYLYGVFDGHDGSKVSNFATQRMPAELLLGQLMGKATDAEIEEVLRQVSQGLFTARRFGLCLVMKFSQGKVQCT